MKLLKPNFISTIYSMLIFAVLLTGACKKEKKPVTETVKSLVGGWVDVNQTANFETHLNFGGRGEFNYTLVLYGNPTTQTSYNGTYITKGDSLKVMIKEKVEQSGQNPAVKTPSNITLYDDRTTFMLNDNILTLKYITYPADAPILTEVKFHRQLPD